MISELRTILFATDFSECSEAAFAYAVMLSRKFGARLVLLHVINEPVDLRGFYVPHISFETLEAEIEESAKKMMAEFCARRMQATDRYETVVVSGMPHEEICQHATAQQADIVVIGTHGRSGLDHLLFGSTAEKVVRRSEVPVLTIRQRG